MGPTQGPYILQLCMGPSYFWGSDPPPPPYFAHWSSPLHLMILMLLIHTVNYTTYLFTYLPCETL